MKAPKKQVIYVANLSLLCDWSDKAAAFTTRKAAKDWLRAQIAARPDPHEAIPTPYPGTIWRLAVDSGKGVDAQEVFVRAAFRAERAKQ